jgi:SlyX protein
LNTDSRIEDIETQLAHQERAISELNEVIISQQQQIDRLQRDHSRMLLRLQELMATSDVDASADTPPPHY